MSSKIVDSPKQWKQFLSWDCISFLEILKLQRLTSNLFMLKTILYCATNAIKAITSFNYKCFLLVNFSCMTKEDQSTNTNLF